MSDTPLQILYQIPTQSQGAEFAHFDKRATTLKVEIGTSREPDEICVLIFPATELFNFRSEPFSLGFHRESYDAVCEVMSSTWISKLDNRQSHISALRHFVFYVSNVGYFEVAAERFEFSHH